MIFLRKKDGKLELEQIWYSKKNKDTYMYAKTIFDNFNEESLERKVRNLTEMLKQKKLIENFK